MFSNPSAMPDLSMDSTKPAPPPPTLPTIPAEAEKSGDLNSDGSIDERDMAIGVLMDALKKLIGAKAKKQSMKARSPKNFNPADFAQNAQLLSDKYEADKPPFLS